MGHGWGSIEIDDGERSLFDGGSSLDVALLDEEGMHGGIGRC